MRLSHNKKKHKALIIKQIILATQRNAASLELFILCYTNTRSRLHTDWLYPASRLTHIAAILLWHYSWLVQVLTIIVLIGDNR